MDEAERYATEAHKVHTELLVREAGGQQTDGGLLVAHAQDHFMMATLSLSFLQTTFQICHIGVCITITFCFTQTYTVDDRSVVQ